MSANLIEFLVLLNPFALFLYLLPIMKELDNKTFNRVLLKASFISLAVFVFFLLSGDFLIKDVFRINFDSFRIFGGIIIFTFAYLFIIKGEKALIKIRGDIDELASEIALPFMVGAGTISLSILTGLSQPKINGFIILISTLTINFFIIIFLKKVREHIDKKKLRLVFDHNMEILLRITGFFVGAIGINMIVLGISQFFIS